VLEVHVVCKSRCRMRVRISSLASSKKDITSSEGVEQKYSLPEFKGRSSSDSSIFSFKVLRPYQKRHCKTDRELDNETPVK